MNLAQLHIMLVHVPVLGTPLLLYIGFSALRSANLPALKLFYWMSFILALLTGIAYFTGPSTADWVKEYYAHYAQDLVENHALWGRFAFTLSVFSGVLAIMPIASYAQEEVPHKSIPWILIGLQVLNLFLLLYTAHLGALIRRVDLLL